MKQKYEENIKFFIKMFAPFISGYIMPHLPRLLDHQQTILFSAQLDKSRAHKTKITAGNSCRFLFTLVANTIFPFICKYNIFFDVNTFFFQASQYKTEINHIISLFGTFRFDICIHLRIH